MTIPFNMEYDINISLREVPKNANEFSKGIQFIQNQINQSSAIEKARLLSKLGVNQRINGDAEASMKSLLEADKLISVVEDIRLKAMNTLRISQTLQFLKQFEEAEVLIKRLMSEIDCDDNLKDLLDFVHQHHGKLLFEQEQFEDATKCFNRALHLRKLKNEQKLIDSTLFAIEVTKRKLSS